MTETPQNQNQPEADANSEPATGRNFSLGRTGRRVAVGASIAVAFLGGMAVYSAVDDREVDADQASLITPADGQPAVAPGDGPRWHDDERFDDDMYEHGDDDMYEHGDDHYEGDDGYERDDDYVISPAPSGAGNGNQPAPMQSGQS